MNKAHFLFLGMIIGLIISKLLNTPITWTGIGYVSIIFIIFSIDRLHKVVMFFFLLTYLIYEPMKWVMDSFNWYEPLLYLYFIGVLLYNFFPKEYKPLFVDKGDITRFPPEYITKNESDEYVKLEMEGNERVRTLLDELRNKGIKTERFICNGFEGDIR